MGMLAEIFSRFHDGGIEHVMKTEKGYEIAVGCNYLAQMENPDFQNFYLAIENVQHFAFHHWDGAIVHELDEIIDLDLEISSAEKSGDIIKVSCHYITKDNEVDGGELWIQAEFKQLLNHKRQSMEREKLFQLSAAYWNRLKSSR